MRYSRYLEAFLRCSLFSFSLTYIALASHKISEKFPEKAFWAKNGEFILTRVIPCLI